MNNVKFFPIFTVATVLALEEAIESQLDEMVMGNVFDDVAFGAINLIEPYMTLVNFVSYLICVGGAALIVRAHGAGDKDRMNRIFSYSVSLCIIVGILFFAVYMTFSGFFVNLVAGGTQQFDIAGEVYFWQCFYAMLFPVCVFLQTCVLYMGGYLYCGIWTTLCMILNPFLSLILGKNIGADGIMLATVIINILEIVLMCAYFINKKHSFKFRFIVDFSLLKQILVLGLGESSIFISIAIMEFAANSVAVKTYNTMGIVAISLVVNLLELVMYISEGISEYETVAINEYIGENKALLMKQAVKTMLIAVIVEGLCFSALMLFAPSGIISLFDIESEAITKTSALAIQIAAIAPVFICFTRVTAIFYQYTGRIKRTIFLFLGSWGIAPALCCITLGRLSIYGVVWGLILGILIVPVVFFIISRYVLRHPGTII